MEKLLNVKHVVVEDAKFYLDQDGLNHLKIHARFINGIRMIAHSSTDAGPNMTRGLISPAFGEVSILAPLLYRLRARRIM